MLVFLYRELNLMKKGISKKIFLAFYGFIVILERK